jgi:hypothetical protein
MKYRYPWPPVEPKDEQKYDIEILDGTTVENVEFWAFGGGFQPSGKARGTSGLVDYPLGLVVSFSPANALDQPRPTVAVGCGQLLGSELKTPENKK